MRYWIKYDDRNEPVGLYRFNRDNGVGEFVNGRKRWRVDNRILAQVDGIGGDVSWAPATKEQAQGFLNKFAPRLKA